MLESTYWALSVSMGLRSLQEAIYFAIGDCKTNLGTTFVCSDGSAYIIDNGIPVPIDEETTIILY